MPDAPLGLVTHPHAVVPDVLGEPFRAFPLTANSFSSVRASGLTGGRPANLGGISIIALLISTATGLRSLA